MKKTLWKHNLANTKNSKNHQTQILRSIFRYGKRNSVLQLDKNLLFLYWDIRWNYLAFISFMSVVF